MERGEEIRQYVEERKRNIPITNSEANLIIEAIKWADNSRPQSYSKQELRDMGFAFDLNGNIVDPKKEFDITVNYVLKKAREWVKNAFTGPFGEGLANSIADEFVKAMKGE